MLTLAPDTVKLPPILTLPVSVLTPEIVIFANVGLAVVCKSCGVLMFAYVAPTAIVTPFVLAKLSVLPPDTEAVPDVPETLNDVLIALDVNATTRPYASVVITGTDVELPTVVAPGPVAAKAIAPALILRLPAPLEVDTTRLLLSYTPRPYKVLSMAVLPLTVKFSSVPTLVRLELTTPLFNVL